MVPDWETFCTSSNVTLGKDAKQVVGRALLISTTLRSFPSCSTTEPILNSSFNSSTDAIYSFVIMHFLLSDMFLFTSLIWNKKDTAGAAPFLSRKTKLEDAASSRADQLAMDA